MFRSAVTLTALLSLVAGCTDSLSSIVLRPSKTFRMTPADFGYAFEEKTLTGDAGQEISIWHVPTTQAERKGIVVVVPGNDGNKGRFVFALPILIDDGWDVILMDYEGFGKSSGTASFDGLVTSARTVFDYTKSQDATVVGFGVSLGTSVLVRIAADYELTACIFESFTNVWQVPSDFIARHAIGGPWSLVADWAASLGSTPDYDARTWIARVEEPKLFLHSPDDNVTPIAGARAVFDAANQPKFMILTQGDHALQLFIDPVLYRSMVNGWLNGIVNRDPVLNHRFAELLEGEIQATLEQLGIAAMP